MRILVFGAGVIGTIYGYAWAQAGAAVTHYVRPGRRTDFERGIQLRLLDGRSPRPREIVDQYRPQVVDVLTRQDDYDFYIVCVRHYQVDSVLPVLQAGLGNGDVVFFTGNWAGFRSIEQALPRERYLWGFPVAGGGYRADGVLDGALLREIHLGEVDGQLRPRVQQLSDLCQRAGLTVDVQENIRHWLWVHFAINSGVIGAAAKAGGAAQLLGSLPRLRDAILAGRDALSVCAARGVDVRAFRDAAAFAQPAWVGALAVWFLMKRDKAARKIMETHTALDDLKAIYRDVLHTADELGLAVPHYRALNPYLAAFRPVAAA